MRGLTLSVLTVLCAPGDNGLSEDLQGGQTPETVPEGSGVEPETEVNHGEEERPDERHG